MTAVFLAALSFFPDIIAQVSKVDPEWGVLVFLAFILYTHHHKINQTQKDTETLCKNIDKIGELTHKLELTTTKLEVEVNQLSDIVQDMKEG